MNSLLHHEKNTIKNSTFQIHNQKTNGKNPQQTWFVFWRHRTKRSESLWLKLGSWKPHISGQVDFDPTVSPWIFVPACNTQKKTHPFDLVGGVPRNQNWAANDALFFPNEHLKKALLERTNLQYVYLTVADLTKFNENHWDSRSITFLSSFFC